jgi:NAD(P)-dependent dehydrogenase (short-subunit alcohol dehydrogenase family)
VETIKEAGNESWTEDLPFCDVRSDISVKFSVEQVSRVYGVPDILLCSQAIDNPPGSGTNFWSNMDEIINVNLLGTMRVCKHFIPLMIENGGGLVVNVGSIQGRVGADWRNYDEGFEKPVGYNTSKAALEQLTRSICVQYGRHGIRAVTMAFGPYDNGKFDPVFKEKILRNIPIGRLVQKESLKATLRYVIECSELTGQTVLVDGGYTSW